MSDFVSCELLEKEIETELNTDLLKLKIDNFCKNSLVIKRGRPLDAIR